MRGSKTKAISEAGGGQEHSCAGALFNHPTAGGTSHRLEQGGQPSTSVPCERSLWPRYSAVTDRAVTDRRVQPKLASRDIKAHEAGLKSRTLPETVLAADTEWEEEDHLAPVGAGKLIIDPLTQDLIPAASRYPPDGAITADVLAKAAAVLRATEFGGDSSPHKPESRLSDCEPTEAPQAPTAIVLTDKSQTCDVEGQPKAVQLEAAVDGLGVVPTAAAVDSDEEGEFSKAVPIELPADQPIGREPELEIQKPPDSEIRPSESERKLDWAAEAVETSSDESSFVDDDIPYELADDESDDAVDDGVPDVVNGEADFDVPGFDPNARQSPWDVRDDDDEAEDDAAWRNARQKAAAIAPLIEAANRIEQKQILAWLIELFEQSRHPATFRALRAATVDGLNFSLLKAMAELRAIWRDRPEWWMYRNRVHQICPMQNGASAMSWALAKRICLARADYPPDAMLDEDWYDEWAYLTPGSAGYWFFASYLDVKVSDQEAELLHVGLADGRSEDRIEPGDYWSWSRDTLATRELGLTFITPFDERKGQITHGPKVEGPEEAK
jgi:hypothetical protein